MVEYKTRVNDAKIAAVDALKEMFGDARDYIFTDYRGLNVKQITDLRQKLRENGADYHVIKNTYAQIALKQMAKPDVSDYLVGPTAVALAREDAAPVVKALVEFAKDTTLEVKGALVGDSVYDAAQAEAFSRLPSREVLIAQLMGVMQAPVRNLATALNEVPSKLVRTLQAIADKKGDA